ncbi:MULTISPECIES: NAD(P)H-binding protein [unclassified Streptomyces]|uniref:NAD(P)-dependent oxidoreductase n=1 Tax=unclassified Streptomyces TaxID=2593676 RepID=UPI000823AF7A|nr:MULTISPECIES: NAD(P)H-binding protein [unclassified Streptomyces]MYT99974.1 NAD(P)H-binding protein [Streptomyces sp. SID8350]SCK52462.1 Putative NADH-flavin reductase [Streptomyces sp. AmelKG-D3]
MRVTVFGGTGPTGLLLINQALNEGHEVTAYARTPSKLPTHERLTAVQGQLDDAAAIAEAVRGSDAVLSTLGPTTKKADSAPLVTGYRHIVAAMHGHGVERLIVMGTPSIPDPTDGKEAKVSLMVTAIRKFQPAAYEAIVTIGHIVRESGLKWTIVRFPLLSDGPRTASINVRKVGDKGGLRLSRANAAAYYLQQLTDSSQIGRAPFITDK